MIHKNRVIAHNITVIKANINLWKMGLIPIGHLVLNVLLNQSSTHFSLAVMKYLRYFDTYKPLSPIPDSPVP